MYVADRGNRRNIITLALTIWSGMTALTGLANNFWHLFLARMGVGIGESGGTPPATSMIADLYPPQQRAFALGVYTTGIGFGIMVGYILGLGDRHPDDIGAGFGHAIDLSHAGIDVPCVAGGHGLYSHGRIAADADDPGVFIPE